MKNCSIGIAFLISTFVGFAQNSSVSFNSKKEKNVWQKITYDIGTLFSSAGYAYSRPFYWKGQQWKNFGYLAAGTSAAYLIDDNVDYWADGWRSDVPRWLADYGNEYVGPQRTFMLSGVLYGVGLVTKNEKLRRTSVLLVSSITATGLLQQVLKRIPGRARPFLNVGKSDFLPFQIEETNAYNSFPSGHAIVGFTTMYAISKQFKNPWVKRGLYTLGAIPGIIRIVDRFHWLSDVVFSTVLSVFMVDAIDRHLDKKYDEKYNDDSKEKKVSWNLQMSTNTVGLVMNF